MSEPDPLTEFGLPRGRHLLSREEVRENQRLRLLAAVAEVLAEKGFVKLTSADVAARAGVSRTTFYEQFEDIGDCLLAAFEGAAACVSDLVVEACAEPVGRKERVDAAVRAVSGFLASEPSLPRLLGPETAAAVPKIAAARERLVTDLATLLRAGGRPAGAMTPDLPPTVEAGLVDAALHLASQHLPTGGEKLSASMTPEVSELLARCYARGG